MVAAALTPGAAGLATGLTSRTLAEQTERTLLRLEAERKEVLDRLLAGRMLLAADDATHLRAHQILLREPAARVLRRAVEYLRLRAYRLICHLSTSDAANNF